jgi:hypothetical protein
MLSKINILNIYLLHFAEIAKQNCNISSTAPYLIFVKKQKDPKVGPVST